MGDIYIYIRVFIQSVISVEIQLSLYPIKKCHWSWHQASLCLCAPRDWGWGWRMPSFSCKPQVSSLSTCVLPYHSQRAAGTTVILHAIITGRQVIQTVTSGCGARTRVCSYITQTSFPFPTGFELNVRDGHKALLNFRPYPRRLDHYSLPHDQRKQNDLCQKRTYAHMPPIYNIHYS